MDASPRSGRSDGQQGLPARPLAVPGADGELYRSTLDDALRPLDEPVAAAGAACRVLAAALHADRVFYAELDGGAADRLEPLAGCGGPARAWPTSRLPALMAALRGGQRVVLGQLDDPHASLLPDGECAALRALGIGALALLPLCKGSRSVALLAVQHAHAHAWHSDELERLEATADRTWSAVLCARSEQALLREQQRFAALQAVVSGVPWSSDAQGAFVYAQPAWQAYTGQDWTAHAGYGWLQAVHPGDREALHARWRAAGAHGQPFDAELRLWHTASNHWRSCRLRARPLRDAPGRLLEWVGACDDVHDAQRNAEALRDADLRKDRFLATLSHELRNPLAPVRSAVRLMSLPGIDAAQLARARDIIDRQTRHLSVLLDDLMDMARLTQGRLQLRRERTALVCVVEAAVESAGPQIQERRHELHLDLPPTPLWLDADPVRLAQVLANLLHNAARFTPPGGRIGLSARTEAGRLCLSVSDNGAGLAPQALESIFAMFSPAAQAAPGAHGGGLGIGLALVRGLVELHGGQVRAHSAGLGQGSCFTVTLPLPAEREAAR